MLKVLGDRKAVRLTPLSTDVAGKLVFLGTGTSVGVPMIGCGCSTCTSSDPHDQRTRSSVVLGLPGGNLLVDTSPDLRTQLLREKIGVIHAVLFTHDHADHVHGLDDLRLFPYYIGGPVPIYCEASVEARIRQAFAYAFDASLQAYGGGVPQLEFHTIDTEPFEVLGTRIVPIRLEHGRWQILGFRVGDVAYCTDTSGIPPESWPLLEGLDVLVLDALRHKPHESHFSLGQAIDVAQRLAPKRTLFTHISHDLGHAATNATLPQGMELAYDGLQVPLSPR